MVKFLFFSALTATMLSGSEVVTLYKSGGKKLFDTRLHRPAFWSSSLMNQDLRFGYFDRAVSLLQVNKEKGSLELYAPDAKKRYSLKKRYSAFTGKNPGDKRVEGDLKTPVGIYKLTEKKKNVDPFYGPLALVTSYPNLYDRIRGKTGDGIWVHGVPISGTRDPFTRGCIAIDNNDLVQLDQNINHTETLLIIDNQLKPSVSPSEYSAILAGLHRWKHAWTYNDIDSYLSMYDPAFKRYDGMGFAPFKSYKERIFAKNEAKTIDFDRLSIIPYPGEKKNLFWVTYLQNYTSDSHRFRGEKSLLLRLNADQSISILTEE
jgi:murein L,D-transpeptidase YafK